MYKRLQDKVVEFIKSEDGKVGVKTSLSLGLVGGSLLLLQTMFPYTAKAGFECTTDDNCPSNKICDFYCKLVDGICKGNWHSRCIDP